MTLLVLTNGQRAQGFVFPDGTLRCECHMRPASYKARCEDMEAYVLSTIVHTRALTVVA